MTDESQEANATAETEEVVTDQSEPMSLEQIRSARLAQMSPQEETTEAVEETEVEDTEEEPQAEEETEEVESEDSGEDVLLSPAARKLFPFATECKNQEKLNIWSSLEQAETNAGKHIPLLVFKRNRSKIYATIEFERLLELLDEDSKSTQ